MFSKATSADAVSCENQVFAPAHFTLLAPSPTEQLAQNASQSHGYAAGYAQGIRAAEVLARTQREELERAAAHAEAIRQAEHTEAMRALEAAADALRACAVPVLEQASTVLVESALLLAQKVIGSELSDAESGARAALERSLAGVDVSTVRHVRMSPLDLQVLGLDTVPNTSIALVPDPSLSQGDALTAFDEGFLDARIHTAFERASAALRSAAP